jgi:hypothetical protein
MEAPLKFKIELPYDSKTPIPFLHTYPMEMQLESKRNVHVHMFIEELFTIAKYGSNSSVHQGVDKHNVA